jgi:hypothetical protein
MTSQKKNFFDFVELVENHMILEKNFSDQIFKIFEAESGSSKSDLMITRKKWHEMLKHSRSKTIFHLKNAVNEIKIDDLESTSSRS